MEEFEPFLAKIDNPDHRMRVEEVFEWIMRKYPNLETKIAWNQPMFTDHGTFIVGFSVAKQHMAVAPERAGMNHIADDLAQGGHDHTQELVRFKWNRPFDYALLEKMIDFNIIDKASCTTFWRK